ncbi:MAG: hypothetical protein NTV80_09025 [Verrucomicrobia bacterium]|nr:hypothetical protein [Verrucomicrobiota bacterium]
MKAFNHAFWMTHLTLRYGVSYSSEGSRKPNSSQHVCGLIRAASAYKADLFLGVAQKNSSFAAASTIDFNSITASSVSSTGGLGGIAGSGLSTPGDCVRFTRSGPQSTRDFGSITGSGLIPKGDFGRTAGSDLTSAADTAGIAGSAGCGTGSGASGEVPQSARFSIKYLIMKQQKQII